MRWVTSTWVAVGGRVVMPFHEMQNSGRHFTVRSEIQWVSKAPKKVQKKADKRSAVVARGVEVSVSGLEGHLQAQFTIFTFLKSTSLEPRELGCLPVSGM
jgi:hypothetical protein